MRLSRHIALILLIASAFFGGRATAGTAMGGENCGKPVRLTSSMVRKLSEPDLAFPGQGKLPAFFVSSIRHSEDRRVDYLLVKRRGHWRGWIFAENSMGGGSFVAPRHGSAAMFAMWGVEGPGKDHTVLSTRDGFRTVQCAVLPAPPDPKGDGNYILDYMSILSFGGDQNGRAWLTGEVQWNDTAQPTRYQARGQLGRDWRTPVQTSAGGVRSGVFMPLKNAGARRLLRDIRRAYRSR